MQNVIKMDAKFVMQIIILFQLWIISVTQNVKLRTISMKINFNNLEIMIKNAPINQNKIKNEFKKKEFIKI